MCCHLFIYVCYSLCITTPAVVVISSKGTSAYGMLLEIPGFGYTRRKTRIKGENVIKKRFLI